MSLTNSGKSFLPFPTQYYRKKPNETNKNRLIPLSFNDERSVDKLTTRPPPKSPPVDDDPWHLDGRKGRYLIIKRHKITNVFIAPTYSQITSQSFESRSEAAAAMKIICRSLITPIQMVLRNTITLQTLPEEVIQPQVHPAAPETSSLFVSKQRNSDEIQRNEKMSHVQDSDPAQSHVQDSDPSQSHDANNKLDDNGHCDNDTTESQKRKRKEKEKRPHCLSTN